MLTREQIVHNLNKRKVKLHIEELGGDVFIRPATAAMEIAYAKKLKSAGILDESLGSEQDFDFETATDEQVVKFVEISASMIQYVVTGEAGEQLLSKEQAESLGWPSVESILNSIPKKKEQANTDTSDQA